jgi:hypothetical protein
MSYYLPCISARDEDNWQRYTIGLDDKSIAAARAYRGRGDQLVVVQGGAWPPGIPRPFGSLYAFLFKRARDGVILR